MLQMASAVVQYDSFIRVDLCIKTPPNGVLDMYGKVPKISQKMHCNLLESLNKKQLIIRYYLLTGNVSISRFFMH